MKHASDIILKPVVSEKSMMGASENKQYTFEVATDANKIEIAKAVEELFAGVYVKKVSTQNYYGKLKRMGQNIGRRARRKKAIVTLTKKSKTIEFFDGMV